MPQLHSMTRPVTAAAAMAVLALAAGCSRPADAAAAAPTTALAMAVPQTKAASKLGDLSAFSRIAVDVATLVDQGDLPAAKTRIKALEIAWDSAEAGLKPRAAADWHVLDKAIDTALSALRAARPNPADCKQAMTELQKTFDSSQGKS